MFSDFAPEYEAAYYNYFSAVANNLNRDATSVLDTVPLAIESTYKSNNRSNEDDYAADLIRELLFQYHLNVSDIIG